MDNNLVNINLHSDLNFLKIEKKYLILTKKNINAPDVALKQLNYELMFYGNRFYKNKLLFTKIEKKIVFSFNNLNVFSKELGLLLNLFNINKNIIQTTNTRFCEKKFTAQLLTNWILLSLNTNLIDRSYFDKENVYFNRYDCVDKFAHYFNLYLNFYDDSYNDLLKNVKEIKHLAFTIFNMLENWKILTKKIRKFTIKKNTKNKIKESVRTYIFYKLENFTLYDNEIDFNVFLVKPEIKLIKKTFFIGGVHYSTLCKVFKTNSRSDKIFELGSIEFINKFVSLKYKIDFEYYNTVYNLICNDLQISDNSDLKSWVINNLENHYNKGLYENLEEETEEDIEDKKKIFQKTYSKYLLYYIFAEIKTKFKNINEFYLTIHFDFRGRVYPKSCISPVGPKIFRYLYYYGFYTPEELNKINVKNIKLSIKLVLNECLIFKIFDKINLNHPVELMYVYWCVFEIGKIFKNELSAQKNGFFNDEDLIKHGVQKISKILNNTVNLSFEENLEYQYILSGLKNLNEGKYKKLIIYKDATASGIQLLTVILDPKNDEIAENCNLKSFDYWYDTYYYIIKLFLKKHHSELSLITPQFDFRKYVQRKFLKPSVMTYIYGAGEKTALLYYLNSLPENFDKEVGKKIFILFYDFLGYMFKSNEFFKTPLKTLVENGRKEFNKTKTLFIVTTDESKIFLEYYVTINYRLDRKIGKQRNTIRFTNLSSFKDDVKTWRSLPANITQSLDALFVRLIIKNLNYPIITIHDCFGIDVLNIDLLIDVANSSINNISYSYSFIPKIAVKNYYSNYILF